VRAVGAEDPQRAIYAVVQPTGSRAAAEPPSTRRIDTLRAGFNQPRRLLRALYFERHQAELLNAVGRDQFARTAT
jgi:hypothetical protein